MTRPVRLGSSASAPKGPMHTELITDGTVPNVIIGAICDNDPAKAEIAATTYPQIPFSDNYPSMLDSGDVDAVTSCVPHYLHPQIGIDTLQHGLHAPV